MKRKLMAYQSRSRKRVNALLRAPNGSAFQTCETCGVSIAVALVDMHQCEYNQKDVKKLKVKTKTLDEKRFQDQPRSEFRFFMESFVQNCDIKGLVDMDRKGFDAWKKISPQERLKYELLAKKVNDAYYQKIVEEEDQIVSCVDEEADSAEVGKFDKTIGSYDNDSDGSYDDCSYDDDDCSGESDCIGLSPWWW